MRMIEINPLCAASPVPVPALVLCEYETHSLAELLRARKIAWHLNPLMPVAQRVRGCVCESVSVYISIISTLISDGVGVGTELCLTALQLAGDEGHTHNLRPRRRSRWLL